MDINKTNPQRKRFNKKELSPIDCEDNARMISLGLRPPLFEINRSVFRKTSEEQKKLNVLKRTIKLSSDKGMFRDIHRKPIGCLIVHIKPKDRVNKVDGKMPKIQNTFNYKCAEHEIIDIMSTFHQGANIIIKKFNGRTI